jgi:hypothetical protein
MARIAYPHFCRIFCLMFFCLVFPVNGYSQSDALAPGEGVITRFSGTRDVANRDGKIEHNIDLNGIVASVIDLRYPRQKPQGQHWINEPQRLAVYAGDVGQVFGVALDDASPPNIYLSATSAFGLYRTPDNSRWMVGMWGRDGGPGTIYKLTAANGYRPSVFARVKLKGRANAGTGLGNIAYDRVNKQLFASDLETGMIHRFDIKTGRELGIFDHGVEGRRWFFDVASGKNSKLPVVRLQRENRAACEDMTSALARTPACWHYTNSRRRVWGLGVHVDGWNRARLYYGIWGAVDAPDIGGPDDDGRRNRIWSIGLKPGGGFDRASIRREFALPVVLQAGRPSLSAPADIAFSQFGEMLIGERGEPVNSMITPEKPVNRLYVSQALQYRLDRRGQWLLAGVYALGNRDGAQLYQPERYYNSAGGVAWGYGYDQQARIDLGKADGFVWLAGDSLCSVSGPCLDPRRDATSDSDHVSGIEGRQARRFSGNLDASFKIDSDINVTSDGRKIARTLQARDDSRGAGDIEVYVVRRLNKAVLVDRPKTAAGKPARPRVAKPVVKKTTKARPVRVVRKKPVVKHRRVKKRRIKKRVLRKRLKKRRLKKRRLKKPRVRRAKPAVVNVYRGGKYSRSTLHSKGGGVRVITPSHK